MYQRILVAIDGSSTSDLALGEAVKLAADQHARIKAVHVIEEVPAMYFAYADGVDMATVMDSVRQAGQEAIDNAVKAAKAAGQELETELLEQQHGRVGETIIDAATAWNADLIIIGTHGRHGLAHLIMGSVAEAVVRHSKIPVLLLRGE